MISENKEKLVDDINNIIKEKWLYTRKEVPIFTLSDLKNSDIRVDSEHFTNNSNASRAIRILSNKLGVTTFNIILISYTPAFHVTHARKNGFSFSGRNILLIAYRKFEANHFEYVFTTYTKWY